MNWNRKLATAAAVALSGMSAVVLPVWAAAAADYPARPLRLVVPFPPGGAADILARGVAPAFSERLRHQVVVDNRPGANGVIGFELVARSPADGYTLLLGFTTGVAINPFLVSKASYDPERDFAAVSMLARTPMTLIANPSFPAKSVQELIAMSRTAPGKLSYASPGTGNPNHLAGELFKTAAGVNLVHVPYKGAGAAMVDVMAGHVPIAFVTLAAALPQVRAGKLKSLAVTSETRWPALPGVPTMAEAGLSGVEVVEWFGLLAPALTARAVISRLSDETSRIVGSPDIQQRLAEQGLEPVAISGEQFAAIIRSDIVKLSRVIKQAGIRAE